MTLLSFLSPQELLLAEEWAKKNKLKFPPIKAELQYKKHGMKEVYVFRHPKDPTCPIVVHIVLANKTFKQQIKPGTALVCFLFYSKNLMLSLPKWLGWRGGLIVSA